ncbi:hypothetical protein [Cyclobacterium xiamenense]|uniref:hypothetical protein n=1 Tax=Cyclobacterium xiamenense TaxID=1297121 RepID=UPI0035D03E4D
MKFVKHSIQWAKGEVFEGVCIGITGLLVLILASLLWKYGSTENARVLVLPTLGLGILFVLMGSFMVYSNSHRQLSFQQSYDANANQFLLDEKKRVEAFQVLYPTSLSISFACFVATIAAFVWSKNPHFHAVGLALSVFGLSLLIIDYFSKERASVYYAVILQYLP